jgi:hypothetical protein
MTFDDLTYFYCRPCARTHDAQREPIPEHCKKAAVAFNLECTKCDIEVAFDCSPTVTVQQLVDDAVKRHRETAPDCSGELIFTSQFFMGP